MGIEINEYVRTEHHGIVKVIKIEWFDTQKKEKVYYTDTKKELLLDSYEAINHNKNIAELIEERRLCKWLKNCKSR